jgi:hypothetical protein
MSMKYHRCIFPADQLPHRQPARLPEDSVPDHDAPPTAAHLPLPPSSSYPASTRCLSGWHPWRNGDTAPPSSTSPTSTLCSLRCRAPHAPQTFCLSELGSCLVMCTAATIALRPAASLSGPMSHPSNVASAICCGGHELTHKLLKLCRWPRHLAEHSVYAQ